MNWAEIRDKYPKAYFEAFKRVHMDGLHNRDLYDFFDEHDLHIVIAYGIHDYDKGGYWAWDFEIGHGFAFNVGDGDDFKTRKEAENAAFTKCFEVFEEILAEKEKEQKK